MAAGAGAGGLRPALKDRGSRLILRRAPRWRRCARWWRRPARGGGLEPALRPRGARARYRGEGRCEGATGSRRAASPAICCSNPGGRDRAGRLLQGLHPLLARGRPRPRRGRALPRPSKLPRPTLARQRALADWQLGAAMNRGADVVARHARVGEAAARTGWMPSSTARSRTTPRPRPPRPRRHLAPVRKPDAGRDRPAHRLGRRHARARERGRGRGAETFLKELVWREFAYHLLHHTPAYRRPQLAAGMGRLPWRGDNDDAERWRQGRTGVPFVDAAMREMYVTGTMHNRGRMIVASYLTKHLLTHWRVGLEMVRGLPDRLGPGGERDGLAMGGRLGPRCRALFPHLQPRHAGREVRPRRRLSPPLHRRALATQPGRDALGLVRGDPGWGLSPTRRPIPTPSSAWAGRARTGAFRLFRHRATQAQVDRPRILRQKLTKRRTGTMTALTTTEGQTGLPRYFSQVFAMAQAAARAAGLRPARRPRFRVRGRPRPGGRDR
jgi:deoxyribodipyrimidine photo-lyase